jgi:hypothetical protein
MPVVSPLIAVVQARGAAGMDRGGDSSWAGGLEVGGAIPWAPILIVGIPAAVAIALVWLYFRTATRLKQAQLAPPVWLLPYLAQASEAPPSWPPREESAETALELAEHAESVGRLAQQKRAILLGLALNFVAGWAMAGMYLYESRRGNEFAELPGSSRLETSVDTLGYVGLEGREPAPDRGGASAAVDPEFLRPAAPPPPPVQPPAPPTLAALPPSPPPGERPPLSPTRRRDSLLAARRIDSLAMAAALAAQLRDSITQAIRDSVARATPPSAPLPRVVPPPAPPPPPPPDPGVELARANEVVRAGANALIAAIRAREGVGDLLAPGSARDAFLRFVQQSGPSASLVSVPDAILSGSRAEATVTIQFQWRGSFGDTRRRSGRFQAVAVREGGVWRAVPFAVLDNLP